MTPASAPPAKQIEIPSELRKAGSICRLDFVEIKPAVYFLIRDRTVVYVGQSRCPRARVAQHIAESVKRFDAVLVRHCPVSELDSIESMFIHMLEPEYNCTTPNGKKLAPIDRDACTSVAAAYIATSGKREASVPGSKALARKQPPGEQSGTVSLLRLPEVMRRCGLG